MSVRVYVNPASIAREKRLDRQEIREAQKEAREQARLDRIERQQAQREAREQARQEAKDRADEDRSCGLGIKKGRKAWDGSVF